MMPSYCDHHHAGRAAPDVTTRLNLLTRVWALTKTFVDGDLTGQLQARVRTVLASEEDGLGVVDPARFVLQPGDLGEEFTHSLLARSRDDTQRRGGYGLGPDG